MFHVEHFHRRIVERKYIDKGVFNVKKKIKLNDSNKTNMKRKISKYFSEERGEDLGELACELVLDFFMEELAPEIYNQGVEDSYVYMKDSIEDLFALQVIRR